MRRKKGMELKLCEFLWKNHAENVHLKLVADPFFYFRKQRRTAYCMQ